MCVSSVSDCHLCTSLLMLQRGKKNREVYLSRSKVGGAAAQSRLAHEISWRRRLEFQSSRVDSSILTTVSPRRIRKKTTKENKQIRVMPAVRYLTDVILYQLSAYCQRICTFVKSQCEFIKNFINVFRGGKIFTN